MPFAMDRDSAGRRLSDDADEVVSPVTGANLNPISPISPSSDDAVLDVRREGHYGQGQYQYQYQESETLGQTHVPQMQLPQMQLSQMQPLQMHQTQLHQSPSSRSDDLAHEPYSTATHEDSEAYLNQPQPDVQQTHPSQHLHKDPRHGPSWRPLWLTPGPLGALVLLFVGSAIALISMLAYSESHDGLSNANDSLVYLWRFGPTACKSLLSKQYLKRHVECMLTFVTTVFTSLTVLWARVEFQVLRYTPWYTLENGATPRQDVYDLDYTSMLIHTVLFQSFRNRHHLVFLATLVSAILRVMTVLSPSIFSTAGVEQTSPAQIQVLDAFRTEPLGYNTTGNVTSYPWHAARAIHQSDMVAPFGAGLDFAYQTFGAWKAGHVTRATTEEPLDVEVDGLFMDMTCLGLEEYSGPRRYDLGGLSWMPDLNLTLKFEDCEESFSVRHDFESILPAEHIYGTEYWQMATRLKSKNGRPCASLPQQYEQFIYWGAHATPVNETEPQGVAEIDKVAGVICSPRTWLSKVRVVDDGLSPNATPIYEDGGFDNDDRAQVSVDVDLWDLLMEVISSVDKWIFYLMPGRKFNYSPSGPLAADQNFMGLNSSASDPSIYDNAILNQAVMNLTTKLGPLVGHSLLREERTSMMEASSTAVTDRLLVSLGVGVALIVLCVLCLSAALWIMLRFRAIKSPWYRDPATLLGTMALLQDGERQGAVQTSEGENSLKEEWEDSSYTHLPLRLWARLSFLAFATAILVGLLVSLDASHRNKGLSTIDESNGTVQTSSVLWKSIPTLAVVCVSLYVGSSDTAVRSLALFARLAERPCKASIVDLSLRDMIGFTALYHSIRLKILAVSVTQTLAIFCGFLTVLSAVLFDTTTHPEVFMMEVEPKSWFAESLVGDQFDESKSRLTYEAIYSLWNASNVTYPPDTYGDIMFPTTNIGDLALEDAGISRLPDAGTVVDITLPGARLASACEKLDTKATLHSEFGTVSGNFTQSFTCPNGTILTEYSYEQLLDQLDENEDGNTGPQVFAREIYPFYMDTSPGDCKIERGDDYLPAIPWQIRTYAWGAISQQSPRRLEHLSAWRCNHSWVEVTTDVRYVPLAGGGFAIDNTHPPKPRTGEDKVKPWTPPIIAPNFDRSLHTTDGPNWPGVGSRFLHNGDVSLQFQSLMQPFGTLRPADLGRKEMEGEVLAAMKKNIAFVGAQLGSVELRYTQNETYLAEIDTHGKLEPLQAVVQNTRRQRLVQNGVITYIIVGILALVIAANIWALLSSILLRHLQASRKRIGGSKQPQPAWVLDFELRGTAPEGFASMSRMDALLRASNFASFMPDNAHVLAASELHRYLTGRTFRLGWFFDNREWKRVYTVGVTDDEHFNAMGPAIEK